jgi:hypothetical protein
MAKMLYRRLVMPAHGSAASSGISRIDLSVNRAGVKPSSCTSRQWTGVATCAPGRARTE